MRPTALLVAAALMVASPALAQTIPGLIAPGAPPKLTATPASLAMARKTVEAQMRADQSRQLDNEASGIIAQAQIAQIADPSRRSPLPDSGPLRAALEVADKPNLEARIVARAQTLAETLTPDELTVYSAYVTSPAYVSVQGKLGWLDRQAQQTDAKASDQRRIQALTTLCTSASGQFQAVYCRLKEDAETDASLRAGSRR
jgi:hypothetical protein